MWIHIQTPKQPSPPKQAAGDTEDYFARDAGMAATPFDQAFLSRYIAKEIWH